MYDKEYMKGLNMPINAQVIPNLTDEDIKALHQFREDILTLCEVAIVELENKLSKGYEGLEHEAFLELIDQTIDEFTYDAMADEIVDNEDGYYNMC